MKITCDDLDIRLLPESVTIKNSEIDGLGLFTIKNH